MAWYWKALIIVCVINDLINLCSIAYFEDRLKKIESAIGVGILGSLFEGLANKEKKDE